MFLVVKSESDSEFSSSPRSSTLQGIFLCMLVLHSQTKPYVIKARSTEKQTRIKHSAKAVKQTIKKTF